MESLNQHITNQTVQAAGESPSRLLVVADHASCSDAILARLMQSHQVRRVSRLDEARQALTAAPFDLMLIDPNRPDGDGLAFVGTMHEFSPVTKTIVLSQQRSAQAAVQAMRCGAIDFIHVPVNVNELISRIEAGLARSRADRQREERLARLKKVCKQLNIARHEISEQIDLLCHDLVSAYKEMSTQVHDAAMASEFRTLIRQELDVEDLLRTALEYVLTKTGPTNAAVFLPDGTEKFALGAYVNYDCPRDSIDMVLEHLGNAICPQMADEQRIVEFEDAAAFAKWVGIDAGMLAESEVIAFSCSCEDECLAVIVLFRSNSSPFESDLGSIIETLRPLFAEQLAQVIRVHQRAQPQWPDEAAGEDDEWDFNDDAGYGFGDLAA